MVLVHQGLTNSFLENMVHAHTRYPLVHVDTLETLTRPFSLIISNLNSVK